MKPVKVLLLPSVSVPAPSLVRNNDPPPEPSCNTPENKSLPLLLTVKVGLPELLAFWTIPLPVKLLTVTLLLANVKVAVLEFKKTELGVVEFKVPCAAQLKSPRRH